MKFAELDLRPAVLGALPAHLHTPTRIQQLAIPAILAQHDVLALAHTGSGKTLAFGLPLLHSIKPTLTRVQAVVLVPTRELATQVSDALREMAQAMDLRVLTLCGGVDPELQLAELARLPQLLVATPGRLLDWLEQGLIELAAIQQLVLDEADRLLEMGFWPDVQRLLALLPNERQTLLFSATLPPSLHDLAMALLKDPRRIEAQSANSVVTEVEERCYLVNKGSKAQALLALLQQACWSRVLVFVNARDQADTLTRRLGKAGVAVAVLHGAKEQVIREQTLADFRAGKVRVLVTTDLLARGIDVAALPVVINLDLPTSAPVYVHRVGRTARAGRCGLAISLVCHQEAEALAAIRDLTGRTLAQRELPGFPVTDQPASGERKRPARDKQANRRSANKRSIKQFTSKTSRGNGR
ncbi:DEAD/DEAH box helicase [Zobellella maritima]|uniref:DEAD/DEAH box helicase n=1 Tax=Zobellella maritima TaxID=2059725 RepID=UPI000E303AB1|nr:DEAD/DEAH box helicase [Zobellella maritima]